jgi:chorismate mutase-like protein
MDIKKSRKEIDKIDKNIIQLLNKRSNLVNDILKYKGGKNMPLFDKKRENQILKDSLKQARKLKLSPNLVLDIFKRILKESHRIKKY